MTNPSLQRGRQGPGGFGVAVLCTCVGYIIWQTMDLRRLRKMDDESHEDFMRRGAVISDAMEEQCNILAKRKSQT